jgi:IS5 family transposase
LQQWYRLADEAVEDALYDSQALRGFAGIDLSPVRAWVEHSFHIVKNLFGHKKLRYRGLAKNTAQLHTLFALANLVIVEKALLARGRV